MTHNGLCEEKHDARGRGMVGMMIEEAIDKDLPICDPHHHLLGTALANEVGICWTNIWRTPGAGHKIVKTVFVECGAMYREEGPRRCGLSVRPSLPRPWVPGASGQHGTTAVAAGIVGFADLTLGADVAPVLEAHLAAGKNRLRGIRQSCTWDPIAPYSQWVRAKE